MGGPASAAIDVSTQPKFKPAAKPEKSANDPHTPAPQQPGSITIIPMMSTT